MTLVRLAVSAFFLFSLPCFSQTYDAPKYSAHDAAASPFKTGDFSEFKLSDSWRRDPKQTVDTLSAFDKLEEGTVANDVPESDLRSSRGTRDCLAIRSYQMAREDKNSDATYLKAYSTCQPTSQYQLKSATGRVVSRGR